MKKILLYTLFLFCISASAQDNNYVLKAGSGSVFSSPNTHIVSLSQSGILSDANLSFGSSTFGTNQTTAIQAILNTASASNPLYLIWDVAVSTDSALQLKSFTYIFALPNCGLIKRDSANDFVFKNVGWVAGDNTIVDSNITIQGGVWNGNGFRGGVAKQLHSSSSKGLISIFSFFGVKNISLINTQLLNARTFGGMFATLQNFLMDEMNLDQGASAVINQDGFDFTGYNNQIKIQNSYFRCGDDVIALSCNAFGGTFGSEHHEPYTGINGDISSVYITNNVFDNGKGLALYDAGGNSIHDLYVNGLTGTSKTNWLCVFNQDIGTGGGVIVTTGSNIPYNLSFKNVSVEVTAQESYDPGGYALAMFECSANNVTFDNITRTDQTYNHETFGFYKRSGGSTAVRINNLKINNYHSYNVSPGSAINQIYTHDDTLYNVSISNSTVDLGASTKNAAFFNIGSGAVINLISASNNSVNAMKYVINNAGTVTNANVINITHTGQAGGDPTVNNSGTFTKLIMNGWIGDTATSGSFGSTSNGNAF